LSIDMYLPAFPEIAANLETSAAQVQVQVQVQAGYCLQAKDGMSRDLLSSSAEDPRRCLTVELEEAPSDDRNGT
jgi:hypothetical protein